jgi:hypothetical protein
MFILLRSIAPIQPRQIFLRLKELMNIELHSSAKENLRYAFRRQSEIENPLSIKDIKERGVRIKYLPFVSYSEGCSQFLLCALLSNHKYS